MFRKRRQADQQAWEAWQWIAQQHARNRPLSESSWRHPLELAGQVTHLYMLARNGTKAIVDFGPTGRWDTWWRHSRPQPGQWVAVHGRIWTPPGTHTGREVCWIDSWDATWSTRHRPASTATRPPASQKLQRRATSNTPG